VCHSNQIFILFAAGVLALYCAVVFPVTRVLGFAGLGCALAAIYLGLAYPIHFVGLVFLATAAALFGLEFRWKIDYLAGIAGAILLPLGFALVYSGAQRIGNSLAVPLGLTLGFTTAALCWGGKRARLNKTFDL
jgi:membrane-bound ClpP family serine protease